MPRVEIEWDAIRIDEPFTTYLWKPDHAHNREYAARVDDRTQAHQEGVLHPHTLLAQANQVLVRQFVMPAWIHTGSEIRFRRLLRVGDAIEVRAVPVEKWEKKGHQFIRVYIAYVVAGEVATEIVHTAIFRVAARPTVSWIFCSLKRRSGSRYSEMMRMGLASALSRNSGFRYDSGCGSIRRPLYQRCYDRPFSDRRRSPLREGCA